MKQPGRKSAAALAVAPVEVPLTRYAPEAPPAPAHLTPAASAWWDSIAGEFALESQHLKLLQAACEAWDRCQQAREALAAHGGLTFTDGGGTIRTHPAIAVERDSRIAFARLLRELALDAPAPEAPRSPRTADYGARR